MRIPMIASVLCLAATTSYAGPFIPAIQPPTAVAPIVRVADGCGRGFFMTPRGVCRPMGEQVVVVERPPVVVRPPVVEEVVVRRPVVPTCGLRIGPIAVRGAC